MSIARAELAGVGNLTHAYFGGGVDGSANRSSTVDRIDYSNDTRSRIPGADLDKGRNDLGAETEMILLDILVQELAPLEVLIPLLKINIWN